METRRIIGLVLIGLVAVILLINKGFLTGHVQVELVVTSISLAKSYILLSCVAVGVVIGVLMK